MTPPFTTPEELLASLADYLAHHTSRFELLTGAVHIQCYDSPGHGWHNTLVPISNELYAAIPLGQGKLTELVEARNFPLKVSRWRLAMVSSS